MKTKTPPVRLRRREAPAGGVSEEPWHLSCKPLAQRYAERLDVDFLRRILQGEKLALQNLVLENPPQIHERFIAPYNEA